MHPGTGVHDHLLDRVHRLLGASRGHSFRVAPAHRLDRDTSGLVVFGVSARGLRGFTAALRDHAVRKTYLARVHGSPPPRGEIDLSLARHDASVGPKMHVDTSGAPALTRYRVVSTAAQRALLEVDLATGRTHQIRAHFAAIGHPLVGDHRYGRADGARRLCLHAWRLEFAHPISAAALCLVAAPPPELRA